MGAYPRSRGGTFRIVFRWSSPSGLSPLARGNPYLNLALAMSAGPIPARAGEPLSENRPVFYNGAYPRSRGGTSHT